MTKPFYHHTVLKKETVDALNPQPGKRYLDATCGGGGHTRELLERTNCSVIAFEWDERTANQVGPELKALYGERITLIPGNFADCYRLFRKNGIHSIDGVIADFGPSQYQLKEEDGFSFYNDSPLDMRMSKNHHYFTAEYIVNRYEERALRDLLFIYGEESHAKRIAALICEERVKHPITTTGQLSALVSKARPRTGNTHPATKTFQALRIAVNKELDNIELFIKNIVPFITPGGRFACISFHSLEDRIVKSAFRDRPDLTAVTKKPIIATDEEIASNANARSAKLRVAEKNHS